MCLFLLCARPVCFAVKYDRMAANASKGKGFLSAAGVALRGRRLLCRPGGPFRADGFRGAVIAPIPASLPVVLPFVSPAGPPVLGAGYQ